MPKRCDKIKSEKRKWYIANRDKILDEKKKYYSEVKCVVRRMKYCENDSAEKCASRSFYVKNSARIRSARRAKYRENRSAKREACRRYYDKGQHHM